MAASFLYGAEDGMKGRATIVYVDGFNLYYGALRGTPYKWLNLERFFDLCRPHDEVNHVRYFTALVTGPARDRQRTYLRALSTLPRVSVILGRFKNKRVMCGVASCQHSGTRTFQLPEEKRTDVNIAVQMLEDAYHGRCECSVVVSGDSDLVPAVTHIRTTFPEKKVALYVPFRSPQRGAATELRMVADTHRALPLNILKHAQLPGRVPDGSGGFVVKPPAW
ncbi:MAG: NYN domain-containing protein [Planctomycetota bacterium]|jgi:hypothetical protein